MVTVTDVGMTACAFAVGAGGFCEVIGVSDVEGAFPLLCTKSTINN